MLRVGGLGCLGLSLPFLLSSQASGKRPVGAAAGFGRAKSCILLYLTGGPPQHETFDPKPDAPLEIRGDFKALSTNVPGIHFSELLPKTAHVADRLAIVRSMSTDNNSHSASGYWMLTGYEHTSKAEVPASPQDWPCLASVVGALKPSQRSPYSAVILPELNRNDNAPPSPGQSGGFMGQAWNPLVFNCDPSAPHFEIDGLKLPDNVSPARLHDRVALMKQLDRQFLAATKSEGIASVQQMNEPRPGHAAIRRRGPRL